MAALMRSALGQDILAGHARRCAPRQRREDEPWCGHLSWMTLQQAVGNQAVTQLVAAGRDTGGGEPEASHRTRVPTLPGGLSACAPLPATVRAEMESSFGRDFAGVRVHAGEEAAASALAEGARAYTAGQHIVFGDGQYALATEAGRRVLAHELAHVVQQTGTPGPAGRTAAAEGEARQASTEVLSGGRPEVRSAAAGIQRDDLTEEDRRRLRASGCPSGRCHDPGRAALPETAAGGVGGSPGPFGPSSLSPADVAALRRWIEQQGNPASPRVPVASGTGSAPGRPHIPLGLLGRPVAAKTTGAPRTLPATSLPGSSRTADDEFREFMQMLNEEGGTEFKAAGEPVTMQPHGGASEAREMLGVTGEHQSMHGLPRSVGKHLPDYDPNAALTILGERNLHTAMDQPWKDAFQNMRRQGRTTASAEEVFDAVANSIRQSPHLSENLKKTLTARLHEEMFVEYGLRGQQLTLPYPNIKPRPGVTAEPAAPPGSGTPAGEMPVHEPAPGSGIEPKAPELSPSAVHAPHEPTPLPHSAEIPHGARSPKLREGLLAGIVISGVVYMWTGDKYAALQTLNPAANTTDALLADQVSAFDVTAGVVKDLVSLTPQGAIAILVYDLVRPRGEFRYDQELADQAIREGRNPFCAQCHGPGGALDPNNKWNRQAEREKYKLVSWDALDPADQDAVRRFLMVQPQK